MRTYFEILYPQTTTGVDLTGAVRVQMKDMSIFDLRS